ncbi:MAG TPA: alpha/beta fold hydrolase [Thermomicrobiales bacterium]|nr:alpha/beta fold hydrolase [Thermomicrobiales bacterium]
MATFVLVHGGWSGGWNWQAVARRLRAAGHEVYAPTLTGLGERVHLATPAVGLDTHVTDIVNVLAYEDLHDVILAGHSYGGMVITGVAAQAPERLAQLVYLDAYVPFAGESMLDLVAPEARRTLDAQFRAGGDGWRHPGLGGETPRHVPHPWKCFVQPLPAGLPAVPAIPRTYVRFTADKNPGEFMAMCFALSVERAKADSWPLRELDIDHSVRANADAVAGVLLDFVPSPDRPTT